MAFFHVNTMFIFLSKFLPQFVYPIGFAFFALWLSYFLWKKKPELARWVVLAVLMVIWIMGNGWVATSLTRSLEWRYLPPVAIPEADVIVVLGGGTHSEQYPRQLVEVNGAGDRVLYSAWLYHQGAAPKILLSGGYIGWTGERDAPADDMAEILGWLDVPSDALILERTSRNTYENAVNSKVILDEMGVNRIILVTSALHMPRSVAIFEKQGLEVIPMPTDYDVTEERWQQLWELDLATQIFNLIPSASNLSTTTTILKEYIGMAIYRLRGWM